MRIDADLRLSDHEDMGILSKLFRRSTGKRQSSESSHPVDRIPVIPERAATSSDPSHPVERIAAIREGKRESNRHRGPAAKAFRLEREERRKLETLVRRERTSALLAERARTLLELNKEPDSCVLAVAERSGHDPKFVRTWRDRYLKAGLDGLKSRVRPGPQPRIGAVSRCQVLAMACGKPSDFDVPYHTKWTTDALLKAYMEKQQQSKDLDAMSRTSLLKILNDSEIRPHRVKMWLHSPDPLFREKVTEICDLYLSPVPGRHLVCVDEKTGMQALGRKHPGRHAAPGTDARMDYEYIRNGTRKLIACWDVRTGEVYGEVRANRRAEDLVEFMEAVARRYPIGEVDVIWDNLNIHYDGASARWTQFNQRHGNRFHFHYTPIHASWLDQVELWFGILQRRVLRYGVFNSLEELDQAVLGFIAHWNANERKPFLWTFKGYPLQTGRKAA